MVDRDSTVGNVGKYLLGGTVMNKWNKLLAMLDEVFGFENQKHSTFRKASQSYDEKTGEHVVVLEYRVRVEPGMSPEKHLNLIRQVNRQSGLRK